MVKLFYENEKTKEINFPLGGIGSGSIGLAGNGQFLDMEIFGRANKGSHGRFTHFAIKAENESKVLDARVLQSGYQPPFTGHYGDILGHVGYGHGPARATMAGVPHFSSNTFQGEYPFATLAFQEEKFPGKVTLEAFNPFIPMEEDDSSIPAGFFSITVSNTSSETLTYSIALTAANLYSAAHGNNTSFSQGGIEGITLENPNLAEDDIGYGNLSVATDAKEVNKQLYWYRGDWFDGLAIFWQDFLELGPISPRDYAPSTLDKSVIFADSGGDSAVLEARITLAPNQSETVRFIYSWSTPIAYNYWNPIRKNPNEMSAKGVQKHDPQNSWKNYYATIFKNSQESALYGMKHFDRLRDKTRVFHKALFSSSLPQVALDAISATMSVIKTPTCLRLEDGSLYGFEGNLVNGGCCEGSCTHVWAYTYAVAFLFPSLERSMRTLEYKHSMRPSGAMGFRLQLPAGREASSFRACVDGQYGTAMRVLREYRISGDIEWLRSIWPAVKSSISYAWSTENPDRWDSDKTGIMNGRQHHTLDMELFGESAWLSGMYLGGLQAGAVLATIMGDLETAEEYTAVFEKGKKTLNEELFNGEYYIQNIDIRDKSILEAFADEDPNLTTRYWNEEREEIKYQYGEGCAIDQVLAGWHANLIGLDEIFEKEKQKKALQSLYNNNFVSMKDHFNPCRIFSLNDEQGLTMFSWPEGTKRPTSRIPYAEETMHGFEYQAATHMIQEGLVEEGLRVVESVRHRYDGQRRNPWNEIECGSNYARSMASYALLLTYSGFSYDMGKKHIGFAPIKDQADFLCFWSVATAWGTVKYTANNVVVTVLHGQLLLDSMAIAGADFAIATVTADTKETAFTKEQDTFSFDTTMSITDQVIFSK